VIAAWMVATFAGSAGDRLADDLTRLGHGPDGAAAACLRLADRLAELPAELRTPPGGRSATGRTPGRVTADRLDEIHRQLRMEAGTLRRVVAGVLADDPDGRPMVAAVAEAAVWLAVQDLRGPVTELCGADADGPGPHQALRALRRLLRPCVLADGPRRAAVGRRRRPELRAAPVWVPRRTPPGGPADGGATDGETTGRPGPRDGTVLGA